MPESELLKYLVECNPSNKSELYDLQRKKTKAAVEKEIILLLRIAESNKKSPTCDQSISASITYEN